MLLCDLVRVTVLMIAAVATALGTVSIVVADREGETLALAVAAGWWLGATAIGLYLGRMAAVSVVMARLLATARTATSLPAENPGRVAFERLWPIAAFALAAGGAGWVWPQVAVVGAGFAILTALSWRSRGAAVAAIEERDGVRFYVESTSAFEPLRVIRTPGLYRDRAPVSKPPPPPPARAG